MAALVLAIAPSAVWAQPASESPSPATPAVADAGGDLAAADAAFERFEFDSALPAYQRLLQSESRPAVRRQIIARVVWCFRNLGQTERAAQAFLLLASDDPGGIHFGCIPLAWIPAEVNPALAKTAAQWLAQGDVPAAALIGASHLLSSPQRPLALERLRKLTVDSDRRIAQLAQAQLWRDSTATADPRQLGLWQQAIDQMPEALRAGPYLLLGQAWTHKQEWEKAALALLRVPILHPLDRPLAARALVEAGRALEQLGARADAERLLREVIVDYSQTPAAAEARMRLAAPRSP